MAIPEVTQTITDGALGVVPPSAARVQAKIGVCSAGLPNTVYQFGDATAMQAAIGRGPMVEAAAQVLSAAGGPIVVCPVNPSVLSTVGSVAYAVSQVMDAAAANTGAGTVTAGKALDKLITVLITTPGALGTMKFKVKIGAGAYGPIITSVASGPPWQYRVPGAPMVYLTFAAGSYVATDTYAIALTGVVTRTGTGPATALDTTTFEALDSYSVVVTIATGGARGAATFQYSLDGGDNYSGQILIPTAGVYQIPNAGLQLTFSADTFVASDSYTVAVTGPGFVLADVNDALTALFASSAKWFGVHVVGSAATAAATITVSDGVEAKMVTAAAAFRYAAAIVECPSTEADATIEAVFVNAAYTRTGIACGDCELVSPLTGRKDRRNIAWAYMTRLSAIAPGEDPGFVSRGPLTNVSSIYRDERATPGLSDARFVTARTHIGLHGYFITEGKMMAASGSDYGDITRRRVMDVACDTTRGALLPYLNGSVRVDSATGYIDERDAQRIEATASAKLRDAVVATGDTSSAKVVLNRTTNLLSSSAQPVTTRIVPLAYLKHISNDIGFTNPALG